MLSGFFIYFAHCNDIFQPKKLVNYVKKRLIRIFPAYWIVFLLVYFLAMLFDSLKHTVPHDAFVLLKSLLLLPQDKTLFGSSGTPVITVAWTLQYEIFFYLLFAEAFEATTN